MTGLAVQQGQNRIGQYEIVRRLRSGGMATVYLGRRRGPAGFARDVVLKLVHPHLSQENQFIAMFMDEARISARINHANVVHVEEFGEANGVFYLVMEHVDGCALSQLLRCLRDRRERLPIDVAVHIACRAAAGLNAAHDTRDENGGLLGIVHRDVSPSNILVARDGQVKIIDFGVAKARGRSTQTVSSFALKGKVRYMSPEQAWGSEIDRRSDVYSLAVVLWELLTGRNLFFAENELALLDKVRWPEILPASTYNAEVSDALDRVIALATSVQPDDRPATAAELRALLAAAVPQALTVDPERVGALVATVADDVPHAIASTPTSLERSPTTPERATGQPTPGTGGRTRRKRLLVGAAAIGVIAIVTSLGIALWPSGDIAPAAVPAETRPAVAPPAPPEPKSAVDAPPPAPAPARETSDQATDEEKATTPTPAAKAEKRRTVRKPKPEPRAKRKPKKVNDTPIAEEFEE